MAEGIARHYFGNTWHVESAGSMPSGIRSNTIQVLQELGISTKELRSKHVDEFRDRKFDLVVTLCAEGAACPIPPQSIKHIHTPMPDPVGAGGSPDEVLVAYRIVRDIIRKKVFELLS